MTDLCIDRLARFLRAVDAGLSQAATRPFGASARTLRRSRQARREIGQTAL